MSAQPPKRENLLLNIVFNILLPTLILTKLSSENALGPTWGLVVALAFPVAYGCWDFKERRQTNFVSIIGFVSILLTGGLGLLQVGGFWFAVKEGAVPLVIGITVIASMKSRRPLVHALLYNDQVIDIPRVNESLAARNNRAAFDRLLARSSYALAASFIVSAALNFGLARYLLKSAPGTTEFNAELGRMNFLSWPVIVVPSMIMMIAILWHLVSGLRALTGLTTEEIFRQPAEKK